MSGVLVVSGILLALALPAVASAATPELSANGERVRWEERVTNRGVELLVRAPGVGTHTLSVRAAP
jgi:ABC-type Fe2+-enterobactin transport system substrate-binding protein